jgi:signal transduction histidine kinase
MAVPVPGSQRSMVGVLDMESASEHAFDLSWSQVLSYLADLIGIALEIETQTAERIRVEAEKNVERERGKQLALVYRELRHNIATEAQIVAMQARELLDSDLASATNDLELRMRHRLTLIHAHATIIEGVVQDIKAISLEPPKPKLERIDVQTLVFESIEACRPRLRAGIELTLASPDRAVEILADRNNLGYCLKCLIQNSVEAIDEVRSAAVSLDEHVKDRIELQISEDADGIRIAVLDSGVGFEVPGQVLFQPLFSTKTRRPLTGPQEDVTGGERVGRILELADKWTTPRLDADRLESMRKGVDILIRDGEAIDVYIRQGPTSDDVTLSEFKRTAVERITTYQPLRGDWPDRGVGLYSVRRIVEEMHGGKITAVSEGFSKGARFTMVLPKAS